MEQITKSIGSMTWAIPIFGVQQLTNVFRCSSDGGICSIGSEAAAAFDVVTDASISQCGETLRKSFETVDKLQRDIVGTVFGLITPGDSSSSSEDGPVWSGRPMDMVMQVADMVRGGGEDHSSADHSSADIPEADAELGWGPVPPAH